MTEGLWRHAKKGILIMYHDFWVKLWKHDEYFRVTKIDAPSWSNVMFVFIYHSFHHAVTVYLQPYYCRVHVTLTFYITWVMEMSIFITSNILYITIHIKGDFLKFAHYYSIFKTIQDSETIKWKKKLRFIEVCLLLKMLTFYLSL